MKKVLLMIIALVFTIATYAQETVTLVVNGEGATKEEATANALRSAIEQSFGVFVSANTQILNDEIVKDEIATIASGNIKEYKELGSITMPDGSKSVSLSATVSINNLISYAKSKGSSTEFAGAVWGMQIKMRKLNAENEIKAIDNMLEQLQILSKGMFRIEMDVKGQPIKLYDGNYGVNFQLKYYATPAYKQFWDLLFNSLQAISLSAEEVKAYDESGESKFGLHLNRYEKGCFLTTRSYSHRDDLSRFYFRNNVYEYIFSTIEKVCVDEMLSQWEIIRIANDGEESITFKLRSNIKDILYNHGHKSWSVSAKNRKIHSGAGFPFLDWEHDHRSGYEDDELSVYLPYLNLDLNVPCTYTGEIGFAEEELMGTERFEIKRREDIRSNKEPQPDEIWYTYTTDRRMVHFSSGMDNVLSMNFSPENHCCIMKCDHEVITIGNCAFSGCSSLESITIPNGVKSIGYKAFLRCKRLESITLPNSITEIDEYAFSGCSSLESITIPNGVKSIGVGAFSGCSSLKKMFFQSPEPPKVINAIPENCNIYVPVGSVSAYKSVWGQDCNVFEIPSNGSICEEITPKIELNTAEKTSQVQPTKENPTVQNKNNTHASIKVYSNAYDGYINIRETPTSKGTVIGVLKNGPEGALCLSQTGEWTKIDYNGVAGYVYTKYLTDSPTEEVTITIDINWLKGIWRNDAEQYAYMIFNNGTFAVQTRSGTLAYGTYMLKGSDIEFCTILSTIQRLRIDLSSNKIGLLQKQDFLNESESQNHIGDLMWTESQYRTLRNEIRTLLEAQAGQNP